MITRDIKNALIDKLSSIQFLVVAGNTAEANLQLSSVIDSVLSSTVSVVYSREESTSRPGDCEDASELVSRNID